MPGRAHPPRALGLAASAWHWRAGEEALASRHWRACTGEHALARRHWRACTGAQALASMHWRAALAREHALARACTGARMHWRASMHWRAQALASMHWHSLHFAQDHRVHTHVQLDCLSILRRDPPPPAQHPPCRHPKPPPHVRQDCPSRGPRRQPRLRSQRQTLTLRRPDPQVQQLGRAVSAQAAQNAAAPGPTRARARGRYWPRLRVQPRPPRLLLLLHLYPGVPGPETCPR